MVTPMLGILGGMGPRATADFYTKLVNATPAFRDQEHIPVILIGDPRVSDRSEAIEAGNEAVVLSELMLRVQLLERVHAGAIAIPCNTAHAWLPSLTKMTDIPFISIIGASVTQARRRFPNAKTALVLGTSATVKAKLYDDELSRANFTRVSVSEEHQKTLNLIISSVKAGNIKLAEEIFETAESQWRGQADVVLLACTELPVAASSVLFERSHFIDTTSALVHACISWANCRRRTG